ncbi:MAG TPA: PVC-type heme-binding CxxCH protein [Pirellulales bacterium]|nr:PVC-type heme-binding CxxCH protein [Pirellulales bacterium]
MRFSLLRGSMRAAHCRWLLIGWTACFGAGSFGLAADENRDGVVPTGADDKPLNFGFETGTLADWQMEGDAFAGQPIDGDTVFARRQDMRSQHVGRFWAGTYERNGDQPQGTLTSVPFKITHPYASFLIAGGPHPETCIQIILKGSDKIVYQVSGDNTEELKPVAIDLREHVGKEVVLRLVDRHSGGWGHINFDDFRFHDKKPNYPTRMGAEPPDQFAHAGLNPEEAAKAMTVPEGFRVTLFAGEPDVVQPIAQAIDDRGRLWVAEAYSYPQRVPAEQARDRILIFADEDGDGRFDSRKVFMEKLNLVSGLEIGFGGVWVGMAPHFMFIPDRDGDDVPDGEPEILLDGWGSQDTHETLNTFNWGPDGWLYGCHGVFTHSRVGKPGAADEDRIPINAGLWRYHPTKHQFEVFAHGTSNPWGVDFNDQGQAFITACVIPHLYHMIQGGRYQRQAGQHFNPHTYGDIQTIAQHRHWIGDNPHGGNNRSDAAGGGHAHAGAMIYLGGSWPAEYRNQLFMNNIHGARLNEDQLAPRGSGYVGDRAPDFLLANDSWSQILNLQYGPDGQMYLIDWYDANQCHHFRTDGHDRTNGRIFKVSYQNAQPVKVDLGSKSTAELVDLLLHENDWYVRHARRLLQERGVQREVHEPLAKMAFEHADGTRRLRGLWALHAVGGLDEDRIALGLANDDPYVRAWTIQLALEDRRPSPAVLAKLSELATNDPSPVVRLYLASAADRLSFEQRAPIVRQLVQHGEDADDHNLPLMYWYAAEPLVESNVNEAIAVFDAARVPLVGRYLARRLAQFASPEALALLVERLAQRQPQEQKVILEEMTIGLQGKRQLDMPRGWSELYEGWLATPDPRLDALATGLALTFGDKRAFGRLQQTLKDTAASVETRQEALAALVKERDPDLPLILQHLLGDAPMRRPALRALAAYSDVRTPDLLLEGYAGFNPDERRDALATLVSRPEYAQKLLLAVGDNRIARTDLSGELVRQIRNLKNESLDSEINKVWGQVNDTPAERRQLIERYKALVSKKGQPPDVSLGRALFAKTCQQCHTLFGTGGKVGPDLTGSNRANVDYTLSNLIDPSALIGKDYQATIVQTSDGRTLTGIVRNEDQDSLQLALANETVTLLKSDIEERELSDKSMMPDDQLKPFSDHQVRSLVAYLASPAQTPLLATADNLPFFFNGQDLKGWRGKEELWGVEAGEIVGKTGGLGRNEFLVSEMAAGDFRLTLEVKLVANAGNSGIQFRSESLDGVEGQEGEVKGYQADVGAGWWGKLYEEHGRGLLWDRSGEAHVKSGEWNAYEIVAEGSKLQTRINGQLCVDLDDPAGAKRGVFALQLHSGGATEVRFRNLRLELLPADAPATASKD